MFSSLVTVSVHKYGMIVESAKRSLASFAGEVFPTENCPGLTRGGFLKPTPVEVGEVH